nr:transposase [Halorubrum ezzemoulense]
MDFGAFMNRRLHGWAFAKLHAQIRYKPEEAGIPVETVDPRDTSTECHACGGEATRPEQATFRCTNDGCWVKEYQPDINAALNIADRYRSGERQSQNDRTGGQKLTVDDSATGGASLTGPHDSQADAETQQATLGTYTS